VTTFAAGDRIAWLEATVHGDGVVYAAALPGGPPVTLEGSGGVIFVAAVQGGTLDDIVVRVSSQVGVEAEEIRDDIRAFVDQLVEMGLLERR
jgi:hypothetical protein